MARGLVAPIGIALALMVLIAWPHVAWGTATIWVAVALIIGVALGWLYESSASLLPPIACHYLFNLLG
jgi:membrane protease YdiL (CAAX protease family)